jgi:hypothetical protein
MDVLFTYGRFNPPHLGHKMMIEKIISESKKLKKVPIIIVSHTSGNLTNPLNVNNKLRILKRWFPNVTFLSSSKNTSLGKISEIFNKNSVMVIGENRQNAFGWLPFKKIVLERPNAAPSATKARAAAREGNNKLFKLLTGYNLTESIRNKIISSKPKRKRRT